MTNRNPLPPRWLKCPRRSELIAEKFVAIKTPLDEKFRNQIDPKYLWTPSMALQSFKSSNVNVGLWIDLTNTSRFYDREKIEKTGIRYVKIECRGHGECPSEDQTRTFVDICNNFFNNEPSKKILVHCTHGFNRSGFLICAYLVEKQDWSIEASIGEFSKQRKPGIYKGDYIRTLFSRYGDIKEAPPNPPELPDWCHEEEESDDDVNISNGDSVRSLSRLDSKKMNAKFMEGIPNVFPADPWLWHEIQRKCQDMCKWSGKNFPGSQPVSLDWANIQLLKTKNYFVSWKADGTRYMMLIDGPDRIFFIDRDNSVFQAKGLRFPSRKNPEVHLKNTLLDGEMIIDVHDGNKYPRYLIYDIVKFENQDVGALNFEKRRECIKTEIIGPRADAQRAGTIERAKEPFGVRIKEFWDISTTKALFGERFTAQLSHEIDGLIFQPVDDPYKPGQCPESLKWKPETHNSIDFRLQTIKTETGPGLLPKTRCLLFVNRCNEPFGELKETKKYAKLNGKIVECTWDYADQCWKFMRERTDKSFPNALETAQSVWETILKPITKDHLLEFIKTIGHNHRNQPQHHQHHPHHQPHPNQSQSGVKRPSDSIDDRNLMPPPSGVNRDSKRTKISSS